MDRKHIARTMGILTVITVMGLAGVQQASASETAVGTGAVECQVPIEGEILPLTLSVTHPVAVSGRSIRTVTPRLQLRTFRWKTTAKSASGQRSSRWQRSRCRCCPTRARFCCWMPHPQRWTGQLSIRKTRCGTSRWVCLRALPAAGMPGHGRPLPMRSRSTICCWDVLRPEGRGASV